MANKRHSLAMFFVIALALATSTMTKFRLPGVPLGFSEVVLLLCVVMHIPMGHGVHGGNQPNRFVPTLIAMLLVMLPGYFMTLTSEGVVFYALYNLIASSYIVVVYTYLHYGFNYKVIDLDQLARMFLLFSTLYFLVVLVLVWFEPTLVYVQDEIETIAIGTSASVANQEDPIYRLFGFSVNPNQLALHALLCTFFSLRFWKANGFVLSALCLLASVIVGVLTHGDAYLFGAIALVSVATLMGIVYRKSVVLGLVVIVPVLALSVVMFQPVLQEVKEVAGYGNQDETRFNLWRNGIDAALESPVFGLGPGAWSGHSGPKELEEAHNSAIDYFTNAGLIGLAIFLIALMGLSFRTLLSKQSTLLGGLAAIIVFAAFHNVLRQPIFWFGVYYIAQKSWTVGVTATRRRRSRRSSSKGLPV